MKQTTVTVHELKQETIDGIGKFLHFLKIVTEVGEVIISIGKTTYQKVKDIIEGDDTKQDTPWSKTPDERDDTKKETIGPLSGGSYDDKLTKAPKKTEMDEKPKTDHDIQSTTNKKR